MLRNIILLSIFIVYSGCDIADFKLHNKTKIYYKVYHQQMTWQDARTTCARAGGILAMPRNELEAEAITELTFAIPCHLTTPIQSIWVGFHDIFEENYYVTLQGEHVQNFYHKWGPNQPNEATTENCGAFDLVNRGLEDYSCVQKLQFICQRGNYGVPEAPRIPTRMGYNCSESLRKCYKFHEIKRNWAQALEKCVSEGGNLAIMRSKQEQDYMLALAADNNVKYIKNTPYIYLGYHDWYSEGRFVTSKDEELDLVGYVDWLGSNPSGGASQNCVILNTNKMDDIACTSVYPFMCERSFVEEFSIAF